MAKTIVYRVFDDEFSAVMGKGQLCEFATAQVCEHEDDYLPENLGFEPTPKFLNLVKEVIGGEYVKTVKQAIDLLSVRNYDVETIEIY